MQQLQLLAREAVLPPDRAGSAVSRPRLPGMVLTILAAFAFSAVTSLAEAGAPPASFSDLAAKVTPAVVNISSTHTVTEKNGILSEIPNFPPGSPFEEFFKQFRDQQKGAGGGKQKVTALGSGFIVDTAGYVVTNNHVIDQASEIQVTLTNGDQYPAKLIGTDAKTDLALLKIAASKPLTAVSFGDSDAAKIGDWVMAVGNPFGLGGSISVGVISARSRDIHAGPFDDFLQIDASINQGNSGGPTFNLDGQVVGINTAIATPNGGSVGIGFAIPANLAKPVIDQLRAHGNVERGWLGVQIQKVTPEIAAAVGLKQPQGALVAATKAGSSVELTVWRNHSRETLQVDIGKLKEEKEASADDTPDTATPVDVATGLTSKVLGAKLAALTTKNRQQFGIGADVEGVVVIDVDADGPAADQGLRPGDVIQEISQSKVTAPKDVDTLTDAAREAKQPAVLMLVNRAGDQIFIAVKLGQA